ncbi:hypothetical protein GCM10017687_37530 [Streptomyces echinatus]
MACLRGVGWGECSGEVLWGIVALTAGPLAWACHYWRGKEATHVDDGVEGGPDDAVGLRLRNTYGAAAMTTFDRNFQYGETDQGC